MTHRTFLYPRAFKDCVQFWNHLQALHAWRNSRKRHEFVISELSETLLQILQSSSVFSIGDSHRQSITECDKQVPSSNNLLDALS